jgi:biotin carboxyl carrier protein
MKQYDNLGVLNLGTSKYKTRISSKFTKRKFYKAVDPHLILSFIPGTVLDILIKPGQDVKKGDGLMILDAMKMQNQLKCSMDGRVKNIFVKKGDKVSKGTLLLDLE